MFSMGELERISYPLVLVVWHDAVSYDEWIEIEEFEGECALIHSVGYMIREGESEITIAQNLDLSNKACSMTMTIPMMWIEDIREIAI
jgi:hypothetical protein